MSSPARTLVVAYRNTPTPGVAVAHDRLDRGAGGLLQQRHGVHCELTAFGKMASPPSTGSAPLPVP